MVVQMVGYAADVKARKSVVWKVVTLVVVSAVSKVVQWVAWWVFS